MGIHRRAVFLDRDGVINEAVVREGRPYPPATVEGLQIVRDAPAALARLKAAGYSLIVVTNQPDVARGLQSAAVVEAMHARLAAALPIDSFHVCFHDDEDHCSCRKPKPGLLVEAARDGVELEHSVMIGDRWRDIEAGQAAGCATVFIDHGYQERRPDRPDALVTTLSAAVDWILSRRG